MQAVQNADNQQPQNVNSDFALPPDNEENEAQLYQFGSTK